MATDFETQLLGALHQVREDILNKVDSPNTPITNREHPWHETVKAIGEAMVDHSFATEEERHTARLRHGSDEIEIDSDAKASRTDDGYWVQAWVWVPDEGEDD